MTRVPRVGVLGLVALALSATGAFSCGRSSLQRELARGTDLPGDRSIDAVRALKIGGVDQWIGVRGADRDAPVLLFLHGGPGAPLLPITRWFDRRIADDFVVVQWDQRGAGKSFSFAFPDVSVPMLVEDACEVASTLRTQLGRERIGLVGHSWGTVLGFYAVQRCSENFFGYVAISTDVRPLEAEILGYRWLLAEAEARENTQAIEHLEGIGPPPYDSLRKVRVQRRWLTEFGAGGRHDPSTPSYLRMAIASPEYRTLDLLRLLIGNVYSLFLLYDSIVAQVDLVRDVPKVSIPVVFVQGRYDRNTPTELVTEYCDRLDAPDKQLVEFPTSAHSPHLEDPERLALLLREKMLPLASGRAR